MIVHWPQLVGALLLLLIPISLFHGRSVRYRPIGREWDRHFKQIVALPSHLIDFGRAILGAWLLTLALERAPDAAGFERHIPLLAPIVVLTLALLVQTFVCKERDAANAAYAFASGIVVGFLPIAVGAFALLLAVTITTGARRPLAYLPLLAISVGAIGYALGRMSYVFAIAAVDAALIAAWLSTFMFQRTVVVAYQARHHSASSTAHLPARR
jgi:hypothetical protein